MQTVTRGGGQHPDHGRHPEDRARATVGRLAGLAAAVGAVAYVGLADPGTGAGVYLPCPSRLLLGLDCPACGGLRGTHDLLHGDVVGALDHNLLLPLLLGLYAYGALVTFAPLVGRTVGPVHPPRWLLVAGATLLAAFMVLRNLPVAGLEFLGAGTS
jgi:hypothetical protein